MYMCVCVRVHMYACVCERERECMCMRVCVCMCTRKITVRSQIMRHMTDAFTTKMHSKLKKKINALGRSQIMWDIIDAFEKKCTHNRAILYGGSGCGRTELASQVCRNGKKMHTRNGESLFLSFFLYGGRGCGRAETLQVCRDVMHNEYS